MQLSQDQVSPAKTITPATSYAYKASLIGRAHKFELTEQGLAWHIAGRSGVWPYAEIAAVRLSFRPVSMQSRRFRADIKKADGARLSILSTSWQTAALMALSLSGIGVLSDHGTTQAAPHSARTTVLTGGHVRRVQPGRLIPDTRCHAAAIVPGEPGRAAVRMRAACGRTHLG